MAMRTRHDLMPYTTNINKTIVARSKVVSNATGFPVQFNKAIVEKMLLRMSQVFTKMEC